MAKSENQGLQIAVIVLSILIIGFSITTYYFFQGASREEDFAAAEQKRAAESRARLTSAEKDRERLLTALNGAPQRSFKGAEEDFTADIKRLKLTPAIVHDPQGGGMALGEGKEAYRPALEQLMEKILLAKDEVDKRRIRVNELRDQLAKIDPNRKTDTAGEEQKFAKESNRFATSKANFWKNQGDLHGQIVDANLALKTATTQLKQNIAKHEQELADLRRRVDFAAETLKLLTKIFDDVQNAEFTVADGEVVRVNHASRTVWINRGSADLLRTQIVFRVYGVLPNGDVIKEHKGELEVTRILDAHLAECQIVRDFFTPGKDDKGLEDRLKFSLTDPIVPGDKIATSLWEPGQDIHFVFAGTLDFNGDGVDDRELARTLLRLSGSVLDAELADDGTLTGALTIRTRFVVMGPPQEAAKEGYDKLKADAQKLGIEILTPDKFLDQMGASRIDPKQYEKATEGAGQQPAKEPLRRRPPPRAGAGAPGQ
ncbi:MAG: hypothetical protein HYS13_01770 [Planctomycetia bacterium]|nr:hypothetical protein [Planctomycetia bacterium]